VSKGPDTSLTGRYANLTVGAKVYRRSDADGPSGTIRSRSNSYAYVLWPADREIVPLADLMVEGEGAAAEGLT